VKAKSEMNSTLNPRPKPTGTESPAAIKMATRARLPQPNSAQMWENHHEKKNSTSRYTNSRFFIAINQNYNRSTEVTVIPPSFDLWKEK
jgi:hypothetical protein